MTKLDPADKYVVLINTFSVEPDGAEALLAALSRATEEGFSKMDGFISANLHISRDRRHVANYAQWRSQQDLEAMMKNPWARQHMQECAGLAVSFDPIYYELRVAHESARAA